MSTSSNKHQADVNMRWERQEKERTWWKTDCVKEQCVTKLCVTVVCERVECERVWCERCVVRKNYV